MGDYFQPPRGGGGGLIESGGLLESGELFFDPSRFFPKDHQREKLLLLCSQSLHLIFETFA